MSVADFKEHSASQLPPRLRGELGALAAGAFEAQGNPCAFTPCACAQSLLEALIGAAKNAAPRSVVLTSPACSVLTSYPHPGESLWETMKSIYWGTAGRDPNKDDMMVTILDRGAEASGFGRSNESEWPMMHDGPAACEQLSKQMQRFASGFYEEKPRSKKIKTILTSTNQAPKRQ